MHSFPWFEKSSSWNWVVEAILVLLAAGLIATIVQLAKRRREVCGIKRIYGMSGVIWYDYEIETQTTKWLDRFRDVFGPQFMADVHTAIMGRQVRDPDLRCLLDLRTLSDLDLSHTQVTSDGMPCLSRLPQLCTLNLTATEVADEGVQCLAQMTQLKALRLRECPVTDDCVATLLKLRNLDLLDLGRTSVGDTSLDALCNMKWLRELNVQETRLSAEAKQRLKSALRSTRVVL